MSNQQSISITSEDFALPKKEACLEMLARYLESPPTITEKLALYNAPPPLKTNGTIGGSHLEEKSVKKANT